MDSLLGDLRNLGLSPTEEEIRMRKFVDQFGGGLPPGDFAEYLYDYYHYPEEYDIDEDGDYYDMIIDYYEEIIQYSRFDLSGPMAVGTFNRWREEGIEQNPIYKLYQKISS